LKNFMFLWFVATIWEMPEYFVPVIKFMMTTVELAKYWNSSTYQMDNIDLQRTHVYGC
jgi:hypothetical protein